MEDNKQREADNALRSRFVRQEDGENFCYAINFLLRQFDGSKYFVPEYAKHRPAPQAILKSRYYEPATHRVVGSLLELLPGNMIHAGTFFGDMLPSFSSKSSGIVYAFEPVLENYILAKLTVDENKLENIMLFNCGLGRAFDLARIDCETENGMHFGGASRISSVGQIVPIVPIDSLSIDQLSILQLDVEGFELDALVGGTETIRRLQPVIMIEDNKRSCNDFLSSMNYSLVGKVPGLFIWCHSNSFAQRNALGII
jgi:FkbM family methyltransferase